jgi:ribonuclease VapC
MMAVDTPALMAIILDEPAAPACMAALEAEDWALIVAARRNVGVEMARLIDGLGFA